MNESEENKENELRDRLERYAETLRIIEDMQHKLDAIEAGKKIFKAL